MNTTLPISKNNPFGQPLDQSLSHQEIVQAYTQSGLSKAEFARTYGLRYSTFYSWVRKYEVQEQRSDSFKTSSFIEIETHSVPVESSPLELTLPSGVSVQLNSSAQIPLLKDLIQALSC